jgi:predicted PurR-regulated permease PerM
MTFSTNKKIWQWLLSITLALTLLFIVLFYFIDLFIVFVVGIALIILVERLLADYRRNVARYNFRPSRRKIYGSIIVIFWIFAFSFLLFNSIANLTTAFTASAQSSASLNQYIDQLTEYVPNVFQAYITPEDIVQQANTYVFSIFSDMASSLSLFLFNSVLIIPLMLYIYFRQKESVAQRLSELVPQNFRERSRKALKEMSTELHDFLTAKVIQSVAVGSICILGFYIGGVKGALVLGILAGVFNIVPYFGPLISGILPVVVSLAAGDLLAVVFAIVTVTIAQLIDNFYIYPFMIPGRVHIAPLLGILLVLIGAKVFGIIGMVFAIPIYLVYKIIIRESYEALVSIYEQPTPY